MTNHYEDNNCARCKNMNQSDKDITQEQKMYFKGFDEGKLFALNSIADEEGWEQNYDYYAIKLGLPTKYTRGYSDEKEKEGKN